MRAIVVAAVVGFAAGALSPAAADTEIAPIVICEAKNHPGCQVYLKADGRRLLYKDAAVSPGGKCPAEFVRGQVTRFGPETYKMDVAGKSCIMNAQGFGRCQ